MAKHVIPVDRFIAEVNRLLPGKPGYREGLEVFLSPRGATTMTAVGYGWTFNDDVNAVAAVQMAADEVGLAFEVYPPLGQVAA